MSFHHTKFSKRMISEGNIGRHYCYKNPELRIKHISDALTNRKLSKGHRKNIGLSVVKRWKNKQYREKSRKNMSLSRLKLFKNEDFRNKQIRISVKNIHPRPNLEEQHLDSILKKTFPNEWKYIGSGDFILGGKNPDFKHKTKKLLIELYDFHRRDTEKSRINHFKQFGFDTLIIWEHELTDKNLIIDKIMKMVSK